MTPRRRALLTALVLLAGAALLAAFGPLERVLGSSARIVYLHGAWVWSALLGFAAAAVFGAARLVLRRPPLASWSIGFGRAGTVLWGVSLLLSLWAMQTSWNGLYLAEPRWRVGVQFEVAAILLQVAITLLRRPRLAAALNLAFALALGITLATAEYVMHPPSPIATSESETIRLFFAVLLVLTCAGAWQLAASMRPTQWSR